MSVTTRSASRNNREINSTAHDVSTAVPRIVEAATVSNESADGPAHERTLHPSTLPPKAKKRRVQDEQRSKVGLVKLPYFTHIKRNLYARGIKRPSQLSPTERTICACERSNEA